MVDRTHAPPAPELLPADRTYLAETRTLLAVMRTGLSIAGGGPVVSKLLLTKWPEWVLGVLSGAFVVIGYTLMWWSLRRHFVLRRRAGAAGHELDAPTWAYFGMTVTLQVLILVVLILFLVRR